MNTLKFAVTSACILAASNLWANFSGNTSGLFNNPVGPGTMQTTGAGTANFTWGDGASFGSPPSSLTFQGSAFNNVPPETYFSVGTMNYYNGTIGSGTGADGVTLNVKLAFTDPAGLEKTFLYPLQLINTPNTGDPSASADYVIMPNIPDQTWTYDNTTYKLGLAFGNFGQNGFGKVGQFHVLENSSASAGLYGILTTKNEIPGVPDATCTASALGLALAALAGLKRKL